MSTGNFFGSMLMALGGLLMTLTGVCTGVALITVLAAKIKFLFSGRVELSDIFVPLLVGGIPFVVGGVLFYIGKALHDGDPKILKENTARIGWIFMAVGVLAFLLLMVDFLTVTRDFGRHTVKAVGTFVGNGIGLIIALYVFQRGRRIVYPMKGQPDALERCTRMLDQTFRESWDKIKSIGHFAKERLGKGTKTRSDDDGGGK